MSVVELKQVSKSYGRIHALKDLDLCLAPSQVMGLLGHNGTGKTTAMKLILGVSLPSAGEVRIFGCSPHGRAAHLLRFKLGYLPESITFYEQLSGREVLRYFGHLKRVAPQQIEALLERVGLAEAAARRVKTYSKGMRQRLGLAQALLGEPQLLLLDEPTVGLDPLATRDFYTMLDELRQRGVSIILCSHVLAGMERHIDYAVILSQGRLLATGTLQELRDQAGLPLLIRVRGRLTQEQALGDIRPSRVNGSQLEFSIPASAKMTILRTLLNDPGIHDVELEPPSLETLYAHFGTQQL